MRCMLSEYRTYKLQVYLQVDFLSLEILTLIRSLEEHDNNIFCNPSFKLF